MLIMQWISNELPKLQSWILSLCPQCHILSLRHRLFPNPIPPEPSLLQLLHTLPQLLLSLKLPHLHPRDSLLLHLFFLPLILPSRNLQLILNM